ncbi:hypothetical protein BUALT_Bualt12G0147400 [Buddleja alternifolia]|uniref:C2 domain-containing protein n=1 Tax=Buddleja alternifolia TaxID=168488 RepID=A0AAV6WQC2_9LAMI|nr:hypothetical protein BUALT_Bualt12G0147400 [Buddleja alternifolia]
MDTDISSRKLVNDELAHNRESGDVDTNMSADFSLDYLSGHNSETSADSSIDNSEKQVEIPPNNNVESDLTYRGQYPIHPRPACHLTNLSPRRPVSGRRAEQPISSIFLSHLNHHHIQFDRESFSSYINFACPFLCFVKMAPGLKPFQLLEINIISAQDLEPISKKMKTYATAWVHPDRKLSSCVDAEGKNNPTWNDKFVFRVDEEFLRQDTSAVMIEIYAVHWFRDVLVGTVRVLVGNLIPPPVRSRHHNNHHIGMRFVALQVRRPSGRPQGILNIGVAVLDGSMRSMPLYRQLSTSAVGYRDLMQDPTNLQQQIQQNDDKSNNNYNNRAPNVKPILRRSRSERSERMNFENFSPTSSMAGVATGKLGGKGSSILSISESVDPFKGMKKKGKASSVISGAELREKPKHKGKKGKASSVLSDSILSKGSTGYPKIDKPDLINNVKDTNNEGKNNKGDELNEKPTNKVVDENSIIKAKGVKNVDPHPPKERPPPAAIGKPISKYNGYEYGAPKGSVPQSKYVTGGHGHPLKGNSLWSDSEVGPSPSEVAAVMAEKRYPLDDNQSSVLDGWSLDESVEGLRSKLERWRTELPPLYDRGFSSSSYRSSGQHARKHNDSGGGGLFSCFGNICGYECQCICGKPPGKRSLNNRFRHSPSIGTPGRSFL